MADIEAPLRFVATVDDAGGLIQDITLFERVANFYHDEGVPATFFTVPQGDGDWRVDRAGEWLAAARQAAAQGHDFQLHGLDHSNCEYGPIPDMIVALGGPDIAARAQADRDKYGHLWRRDLFVERLTTAIAAFENAFGRRPQVFRSGALAQSPPLYEALVDVGMRYVSNLVVDPRGWKYIVGEYEHPGDWDPEVPPMPYYLTPAIVNLPIISEYAWWMTAEKVEPHLALALDDLARVHAAGGVFLLVCHVQCVGEEAPYSRELLHRLLEVVRRDYTVQFQTVSDLVADIEAGAVAVLPLTDH